MHRNFILICINLCWVYVYNLSLQEIINILARIQYACVERLDIGVGGGGGPGGIRLLLPLPF